MILKSERKKWMAIALPIVWKSLAVITDGRRTEYYAVIVRPILAPRETELNASESLATLLILFSRKRKLAQYSNR